MLVRAHALACSLLLGCASVGAHAPARPVARTTTQPSPPPVAIVDDGAKAPPETRPTEPQPEPEKTADEKHAAQETAATTAASTARRELPRGGVSIFPQHRLVGFCGTPGGPKLGKLAGDLSARAKTIESYGSKYAGERKALPVFELIAVVVQSWPGPDGKSRRRVNDTVVDEYLRAARAARALLVLNIQPGHSDFLTEAKSFEKYLREPDVGIALDPEWAMSSSKQKPGASFGHTNGKTINDVATYLSSLVAAEKLPEKLLVFHQVNSHVLRNENEIAQHPGIVLVKSVDGLGNKKSKVQTYNALMKGMPRGVHPGFKLFFDEDVAGGHRLMEPPEVLGLAPSPEYVMYE